MPIEAECPLCGHKGAVPEKFDGKQVKCPECCNLFVVSGPTVPAGAGAKVGGGSASGQHKISPSGSGSGQHKIKQAAATLQGNMKNPLAGSGSGQQKLPISGSGSGQHKIKPANGSAQGVQKKPGSAQGN